MKLIYLSLIVVAGATTSIYPSQSSSKKRGSSTQSPLAKSHTAKKARTSADESETKATSAATNVSAPMDIDDKADKREKIGAADNSASASPSVPSHSAQATQQHVFDDLDNEFGSTQPLDDSFETETKSAASASSSASAAASTELSLPSDFSDRLIPNAATMLTDEEFAQLLLGNEPQPTPSVPTTSNPHTMVERAQEATREASAAVTVPVPMDVDSKADKREKIGAADSSASASASVSPTLSLNEATQRFHAFFLSHAILSCHETLEVVKKFELEGANLLSPWGVTRETIMHRAAHQGHTDLIIYLKSKFPQLIDQEDANGKCPLQIALESRVPKKTRAYAHLLSDIALEKTENNIDALSKLNLGNLTSLNLGISLKLKNKLIPYWKSIKNDTLMDVRTLFIHLELAPQTFTLNFEKLVTAIKSNKHLKAQCSNEIIKRRFLSFDTILHVLTMHGTVVQARALYEEFPQELKNIINKTNSYGYIALDTLHIHQKSNLEFEKFLTSLADSKPTTAHNFATTRASAASTVNEVTQKLQQFVDQQIRSGVFSDSSVTLLQKVQDFELLGADLSNRWGPNRETLMHRAARFRCKALIIYLKSKGLSDNSRKPKSMTTKA